MIIGIMKSILQNLYVFVSNNISNGEIYTNPKT